MLARNKDDDAYNVRSYFAFVEQVKDVGCKAATTGMSDNRKFVKNRSQHVGGCHLQPGVVGKITCCEARVEQIRVVATHVVEANGNQYVNVHTAANARCTRLWVVGAETSTEDRPSMLDQQRLQKQSTWCACT